MNTQFLQKVSGCLNKAAFKIKKASPELLIIGGAIGVIGAAVGACCATRKVDNIIEEHKADVEKIHSIENNEMYPEYTSKDAQKDLAITYAKTSWKLVKLYAPSVILGAISIGCMVASNQILRKRNAALVAAYGAIDGAFKKYRKNVVERFGAEVDKELRFNTKAQTITEEKTDENGKEKKVKTKVPVQQGNGELSGYARCFDEMNPNFQHSAYHTQVFIFGVQKWAQKTLDTRGYLFLNEVYRKLGYPETRAGQIVGWTKNGKGNVDFGVYDIRKEVNNDFILGYEPAVWLDFNVDGPILEAMPE
jgi:hypothetical protein